MYGNYEFEAEICVPFILPPPATLAGLACRLCTRWKVKAACMCNNMPNNAWSNCMRGKMAQNFASDGALTMMGHLAAAAECTFDHGPPPGGDVLEFLENQFDACFVPGSMTQVVKCLWFEIYEW